jgi:hypothetical protein
LNQSHNWSEQQNRSQNASLSAQQGVSNAKGDNWGKTDSALVTHSDGRSSPMDPEEDGSSNEGYAETNGSAEQRGGSHTRTKQRSSGATVGVTVGEAGSLGGAAGHGLSLSEKSIPLAQVTLVEEDTGNLKRSVNDQIAFFAQQLHILCKRYAAAKTNTSPEGFLFYTADCPDAYRSPAAREQAIVLAKKELMKVHDYLFVPDLTEDGQMKRLQQFLGGGDPVGEEEEVPLL